MKTVSTSNLLVGMVTAGNVLTKSGQVIITDGTVLTRPLIMRLQFYNIESIEVSEDSQSDDATASSSAANVSSSVHSRRLQTINELQTFQLDHSIVLSSLKTSFEGYVENGIAPQSDVLLQQVRELYDSCKTSLELFEMLHNMRNSDGSIYVHSLNVALLCRCLGVWLKMSDEDLDTLILCGIFHDIGKLKVPKDILDKPGKYTDEEYALIKAHCKLGYDLLKSLPLNDHVKKAALSHHERCDGSGYPKGLTVEFIDNYAMIVAIADVYDAMIAARAYRAPLCPFQVIANFENDGLQKYNPKYILTFLTRIASTYQHNRILLNDGRSANIVMLNQQLLSKPLIQFDDGSCLDLATQANLYIQAVV